MVFVPHRKHTYGPPRPVTEIALLSFMYMIFVPHRKHTYGPPRPVAEIALLSYMSMMFVPHRKDIWASMACYGNSYNGFTRFQFCKSISAGYIIIRQLHSGSKLLSFTQNISSRRNRKLSRPVLNYYTTIRLTQLPKNPTHSCIFKRHTEANIYISIYKEEH
jgi:hypothetical protein